MNTISKMLKPYAILLILFIIPLASVLIISKTFNKDLNTGHRKNTKTDSLTEVLTYKGIDSVLDLCEHHTYENLNEAYISFLGYDTYKFSSKMKGRVFYKIYNADTSHILVGKYTIGNFLPKDDVFFEDMNPKDSSFFQYLCMDKEILYRFLDLILLLREKGYTDDFRIKDGYRYPSFNKRTGGATYSQHVYGLAIDIYVDDVDRNGTIDKDVDKKIVLDLLDNTIIKDKGGIGRYPWSNVIHFDLRGVKARWDSQ